MARSTQEILDELAERFAALRDLLTEAHLTLAELEYRGEYKYTCPMCGVSDRAKFPPHAPGCGLREILDKLEKERAEDN